MRRPQRIREFQERAIPAINHTLSEAGIHISDWEREKRGGHAWITFHHGGHGYVITVVETISMEGAGQYFESYWKREFVDVQAQIDSFTRRLRRYLSGGSWDEPESLG
jgi:hypothetical protein